MRTKMNTLFVIVGLLAFSSCKQFFDYVGEIEPAKVKVTEFASGLAAPLGMYLDDKGLIWVTEIGTGQNDGKVSVIRPDGTRFVAITGFPSSMGPGGPEEIVGLNHLLVKDGSAYILHANGTLYIADVGSFVPGQAPMAASTLLKQDIGAFVLNHDFTDDTGESNPYNLTEGPSGYLYITDAAANAIIRRTPAGALRVFATFPDITNPTGIGPPMIDAVPTGIAFDGQQFHVSTLTGFPFPGGKARLYTLDMAGRIVKFQEGFTTLTDLTLSANNKPVVVEHAQFTLQGFTPNTGRLILANSQTDQQVVVDKLNLPTAVVRSGIKTYYVNSLVDGKIMKVVTR